MSFYQGLAIGSALTASIISIILSLYPYQESCAFNAVDKAPYMIIKDGKMKLFILTQHGAETLEQRGYIVHLHSHGEQ